MANSPSFCFTTPSWRAVSSRKPSRMRVSIEDGKPGMDLLPSTFQTVDKTSILRFLLVKCLKAVLAFGVALEVYFLYENGLDTCQWLFVGENGYLEPWSGFEDTSLDPRVQKLLKHVDFRWKMKGCGVWNYSPEDARQCFRDLSASTGETFRIGFIGDYWIKDIHNFLAEYIKDESTRTSASPSYNARVQSDSVDAVMRWLPFLNIPQPFGSAELMKEDAEMHLGHWKPDLVVAGGAMWTLLKVDGANHVKLQDYHDYIRAFAEDATNQQRRRTIWKLSPPYMQDARYVKTPVNFASGELTAGLDYYNRAALRAIEDVPDGLRAIRVWSADKALLQSMAELERVAYRDWKHFSNETLFYELQILLNYLCNPIDGLGSCCAQWGFLHYLITSPAWLALLCYVTFLFVRMEGCFLSKLCFSWGRRVRAMRTQEHEA